MSRTRTRIYSFGADGAGGHREDVLRATEMDAARRRNHPDHGSTAQHDRLAGATSLATAAAAMPGRREEGPGRESNGEKAGLVSRFFRARGSEIPEAFDAVNGQSANLCSVGEGAFDADTDTSDHLGVVDVSKVRSTGKP